MLNIKILGPGCANCYILQGLAIAAVQILHSQRPEMFEGVEVTLDHLSDPGDFRKYGILYTPGLVVNEKPVSAGRLPNVVEIVTVFEKALAGKPQKSRVGGTQAS